MRVCGFSLGMGLEDVVHHRQAETTHQFTMELMMAVVHAVTKTMEVIKQMSCLFICQFDNGVLVQRDTATDAVVVRRSIKMINIPGHCNGLCAVKITREDDKYVLLFSDGGYSTKSWKEMITSGVSLDKEMQRKSLQWILEQSMDANCIESLSTHDTDIKPHVIEL